MSLLNVICYGQWTKPSEWAITIAKAMMKKGYIEQTNNTHAPILYPCENGMSHVKVYPTADGIVVVLIKRSGEENIYDHTYMSQTDMQYLDGIHTKARNQFAVRKGQAKLSPRFSPEQFK